MDEDSGQGDKENQITSVVVSDSSDNGDKLDIQDIISKISNFVKQRNFQDALELCDNGLKASPHHEKLLEKKIKVLCHQGQFDEAYSLALQWLQREPRHPTAIKEVKRLKESDEDETPSHITTSQSDNTSHLARLPATTISSMQTDDDNRRVKHSSGGNVSVAISCKDTFSKEESLYCVFCDIKFESEQERDTHCRSDEHKEKINSDEGKSWQHRPPPRGLVCEEYSLCQGFVETGRCPFGEKCTQAHSQEELEEWRERFQYRRQQLQKAREKHLTGSTFIEQLLEKLMTTENVNNVVATNVDYAKVIVNSDLKVNSTTKKCTNAWTFTVTSKICIHDVVLLDESSSSYFHISSISIGPKKTQKYLNLETHCQLWQNVDTVNKAGEYVYRVKVLFKTDIYGTFKQTLVFNFGCEPVLSREMEVQSAPITDLEMVTQELQLSEQGRWNNSNVTVIEYEPKPQHSDDGAKQLLDKYSLPVLDKFHFSEILMQPPCKENYRLWMHQMLYMEEKAQMEKILKYNVTTTLKLLDKFLLIPGTMSTAKYTHDGELFGKMTLDEDLSEDSVGGRLILQNSNVAWMTPRDSKDDQHKLPEKVYEILCEEKGKKFIFFRLSSQCTSDLNLKADKKINVEIQFQLNRTAMCEMHCAVDNLPTLDIVFPSLEKTMITTTDDENWEWKDDIDGKLNDKQKEAVFQMASNPHTPRPPLLILGPFGTGKTYTLAQAAKQILSDPDTRILICCHSNSAADLYIKEFLHPYIKEGNLDARPLRVYYRHRWIKTVSETVLQYCLVESQGSLAGTFRPPEIEDLQKHRIVISTLSVARYIAEVKPPPGFFSHIFLDEAAQALETESLIPLSLMGQNTRLVLAGDHMQIGPEVYSDFGRQQQFDRTLLERLYDLYSDSSPFKIMLCENYRSNSAIVDFTSNLFYDNQLAASGNPEPHGVYYPLTFFTARGEDIQHENSTGYYNIAEVYEVVEQVEHLQKYWPSQWGEKDENSIGVVTPYADQVIRIRSEMRRKKMQRVTVERVQNVQGKQFRVIFLSTVRTRHSCKSDIAASELNLGFLSNAKLLNTAITRAQSLVIVVGDPVSLCLIGKCSKVWDYYLEVCNDHGSFFGMTWNHLRSLMNNAEMTKSYILNPHAPEFVPTSVLNPNHHGQPIYAMPGHHGGGPYTYHQWNPRGAMSAHCLQQMYHQQAYFPLAYPYQPCFGPIFFRPRYNVHHNRGMPFKGHHQGQGHRYGWQPVQKQRHGADSEDYQGDGGVGRKSHVKTRPIMYIPRVPMGFHPYYMHPYGIPDDPRIMGAQPPYQYSYHPASYPSMIPILSSPYGSPVPSGSVSPASSSEGSSRQYQQRSPETVSAACTGLIRDTRTYSPSTSPNSVSPGQQIQLLPNVKHVPSHLRANSSDGSASNSRTSTPVNTSSPIPVNLSAEDPATSPSVESNVAVGSPVNDFDGLRRVHLTSPMTQSFIHDQRHSPVAWSSFRGSQPGPISQTFNKSHQSNPQAIPVQNKTHKSSVQSQISREEELGHEHSQSPVLNGSQSDRSSSYHSDRNSGCSQTDSIASSLPERHLKLKVNTGFSSQFSDDLGTPTEIKNLVLMIDENIDEKDDDEELLESPESSTPQNKAVGRSNIGHPSPGRLNLNILKPAAFERTSPQHLTSDDGRPTYAGVLRRQLPTVSPQNRAEFDVEDLEPQTPMTPAGFVTPGTDINTDPLSLLRNLNINQGVHNSP
ncbi:hypothetical protein CHS0354_039403 [Potamilus streckersoni]|uniref:C3H1-type domain-containing protein n=1 Tax=Potamilus streckersoni TaxID=2493646 RepID=A0AAE0S246_9BIVA|nr:hypothetical protein CHS0354_039403 [Potamilus streckersoni]